MKEMPILFSGPLVRALLAGTKTQTRRLMKPQPDPLPADKPRISPYDDSGFHWASDKARSMVDLGTAAHLGPFGSKGDRLWVRETWATLTGNGIRTVYRADGEDPRTGWDDTPPERRCAGAHPFSCPATSPASRSR